MPRDELPFQLEQNDCYSLKPRLRLRKARIVLAGKQCERPQADAIAGFQQIHVVILQTSAHDGGHAYGVAGGRAHPENIMVAPFDVHGVVIHQKVHNPVRVGSTVVNIAYDVQPVHRQAFNQAAQRHDKLVSAADVNQGVDDLLMINQLVVVLIRQGVEQLVQYIGIGRRHRLAHLGARIFGGKQAAQLNQIMQRGVKPALGQPSRGAEQFELFLGVIDQRKQIGNRGSAVGGGEQQQRFLPDDARTVVQDVQKRVIFAVNITHEVLGTLWQIQDGFQVDDFRIKRLNGGKLLADARQIALLRCLAHENPPCALVLVSAVRKQYTIFCAR